MAAHGAEISPRYDAALPCQGTSANPRAPDYPIGRLEA